MIKHENDTQAAEPIKVHDSNFFWGFSTKADKELEKEKEMIKNKFNKSKSKVEQIEEKKIEE